MNEPRVVAVVLSYWPKRVDNIPVIIDGLLSGTRPPDRIILHAQGPARHEQVIRDLEVSDECITVVRSENFHTRAKFITALLEPAEWYYLSDDDTAPGRRTIERLLDQSFRPDFVTGFWGVQFSEGSFHRGRIIQPHTMHRGTMVQVHGLHGRVVWAGFQAIARLIASEEKFRLHLRDEDGKIRYPHEGDDIVIGMVNPESTYCVAMEGDECWVELDQCGQALQFQEGYFAMRDRFVLDTIHALARE